MSDETRALLHWAAAHALWWRGSLEDTAKEALKSVRGLDPESSERWDAIGMIVACFAQLGRHDEARPWIETLLAQDIASSARLAAMCAACIALITAGKLEDADRLLAGVETTRASCSDADAILEAHLHRARAARALYVGDLGAFLDEVLWGAKSFEELGDTRNACSARANAGLAYLMLGAYPLAEEILHEALAVAQRLGIDRMAAVTEHNLGIAIARQGRVAEAITCELHAIDELHARGDQRVEGGAWTHVAHMRLQMGDIAGGREAVEKALPLLNDFPPSARSRSRPRGRCGSWKGPPRRRSRARRGRARSWRARGAPGGEATVRLVYARALDAAGRPEDARRAMNDALLHLMARAEKIADPVWRQSFLTNVAENAEIRAAAAAWGSKPRARLATAATQRAFACHGVKARGAAGFASRSSQRSMIALGMLTLAARRIAARTACAPSWSPPASRPTTTR